MQLNHWKGSRWSSLEPRNLKHWIGRSAGGRHSDRRRWTFRLVVFASAPQWCHFRSSHRMQCLLWIIFLNLIQFVVNPVFVSVAPCLPSDTCCGLIGNPILACFSPTFHLSSVHLEVFAAFSGKAPWYKTPSVGGQKWMLMITALNYVGEAKLCSGNNLNACHKMLESFISKIA